ncbi:DNA polymerase nu [Lithobates pipiens]
MKVSLISEQDKGHVQGATNVVLNTNTHKNTECLPKITDELKSQPDMCSLEHKVMRTFTGKRDTLVKGEIKFYSVESLSQEEQFQLLEETKQAKALVLTMIFHNGSSQLSVSKLSFSLCVVAELTGGLLLRKLLPFLFQRKTPGICFDAKDFLRSVVPVFRKIISWKKVLESIVLDPRIAAWLLNPAESNPTFEDLVKKYCEKTDARNTESPSDTQQQAMCKKLNILYNLMESLQYKLQSDGLWNLFYTIELPLTTILAVMENHPIQVNKDELKRTSVLLGMHLKDLEHEAHLAAGEKFRLTSSKELREVLYGKLHLHLKCKTKLPRTNLCHFPSTAEPALHLLKDLHPLPRIILEFRQIQKIKSTFVDGLSTCMTKGCVSPTWNQTGTVSGRLSAKHPNIQGVSKLAVQFEKKQNVSGEDREIITINPRSVFVSSKGHVFLAADFSQIELRLLAHFSSDPELLKLFHEAEETDIFANLASQWKEIEYKNVTQMDREQAKRIVYSVIYGVGKERLSECLGTTPAEANKFIERFLQKYRVCDFTQTVVQECLSKGFVISLMGRKRPLPHINSKNYSLRAQAERQAVNFVIQGKPLQFLIIGR